MLKRFTSTEVSLPMPMRFVPLLTANVPPWPDVPTRKGTEGLLTLNEPVPLSPTTMRYPKLKATSLIPPRKLLKLLIELVIVATRVGILRLAMLRMSTFVTQLSVCCGTHGISVPGINLPIHCR